MEKIPLIYERMAAIMDEASPIGKDQKNKDQGYSFRGIDDVYNTLHSIFAKHQVFPVPEVLQSTREERRTKSGGLLIYTILRIKYTFYTIDGSNVCAIVEGEGMDSSDKSTNKASSGALKYALLQVFLIPTVELKSQDPDNETPQPMSLHEQFIQELDAVGTTQDMLSLMRKYNDTLSVDNSLFANALVTAITLAESVDDLKAAKKAYPYPFTVEGPVKAAAKSKHESLTKAAEPQNHDNENKG
jgi:hypothetical protein